MHLMSTHSHPLHNNFPLLLLSSFLLPLLLLSLEFYYFFSLFHPFIFPSNGPDHKEKKHLSLCASILFLSKFPSFYFCRHSVDDHSFHYLSLICLFSKDPFSFLLLSFIFFQTFRSWKKCSPKLQDRKREREKEEREEGNEKALKLNFHIHFQVKWKVWLNTVITPTFLISLSFSCHETSLSLSLSCIFRFINSFFLSIYFFSLVSLLSLRV